MPKSKLPRFLAPSMAVLLIGVGVGGASVVAAPAAFAQARGQGDQAAESFVQTEANRALDILNDRSLSAAAKKEAFHGFVDEAADVPRITAFVLGKYRRSATPQQYAAFTDAFRRYADQVYESRLGEYRGQRLRVTGSVIHRPGDVVVESRVAGGSNPAVVNWRVQRGPDGRERIVDVQVAGVWLAVTEQQDFTSTIDNNHGDIDALTAQLRTRG